MPRLICIIAILDLYSGMLPPSIFSIDLNRISTRSLILTTMSELPDENSFKLSSTGSRNRECHRHPRPAPRSVATVTCTRPTDRPHQQCRLGTVDQSTFPVFTERLLHTKAAASPRLGRQRRRSHWHIVTAQSWSHVDGCSVSAQQATNADAKYSLIRAA